MNYNITNFCKSKDYHKVPGRYHPKQSSQYHLIIKSQFKVPCCVILCVLHTIVQQQEQLLNVAMFINQNKESSFHKALNLNPI